MAPSGEGTRSLPKRLISFSQDAWRGIGITLLITVLTLIFGEFVLMRGIRAVLERSARENVVRNERKNPFEDPLSNPSKEYPGLFADETTFERNRYVPFLIWGYSPHKAKYVNIGPDGLRVVPSSVRNAAGRKIKKYFFWGGSTMIGQGSPDDKTIPAFVCSYLNQGESPVAYDCKNFGIGGYANSQELHGLVSQLSLGDIPDEVIFYDGINEILASMQGHPGEHYDVPYIADIYETHQKFKSAGVRARFREYVWPQLRAALYQTNFGWVANFVRQRHLRAGAPIALDARSEWPASPPRETLEKHLEKAVDVYANNFLTACGLANGYGFRLTFIWQPTIFDKSHLTPHEQWIVEKGTIGGFPTQQYRGPWTFARERILARLPNLRAKTANRPCRILDYTNAFSDAKQTLFYADWEHINPTGNEWLSKKLLADLLQSQKELNSSNHSN